MSVEDPTYVSIYGLVIRGIELHLPSNYGWPTGAGAGWWGVQAKPYVIKSVINALSYYVVGNLVTAWE